MVITAVFPQDKMVMTLHRQGKAHEGLVDAVSTIYAGM
jgi:hypothetical protein